MRAKRDSITPDQVGIVDAGQRRAPGLRRTELAARAGISVEYLTRLEQGRDRNPSRAVLHALMAALDLDGAEQVHLGYLAKITGGACPGHIEPGPASREVRPAVRETLRMLEPGVAMIANRLGDVLAYTSGFELVTRPTGLLDSDAPNLTEYVFTHPRAQDTLPDWAQVADEQTFDLWLGPSRTTSEWFRRQLAPRAGAEFTRRVERQTLPPPRPLRVRHPDGTVFGWHREMLELAGGDAQQLVVWLPADDATATALERLRRPAGTATLRAV